MRRELDYLSSRGGRGSEARGPIGVSRGWRQVVEMVELAAPADTTVLLLGESGTGKEEAAQLLHGRSARAGGAFVRGNCGGIPLELFESEFFGHRRGAFSRAGSDREGRLRGGHRRTLFVEGIGGVPGAGPA